MTSGFSTTLGTGSGVGTGLSSSILSTNGFGVSALGAVLLPAMISENCLSETISIGNESGAAAISGATENESAHQIRSAACSVADMTMSDRIYKRALRALFDFRHQSDAAETGRRQPSHHTHDRTVVHVFIAAHVDALLRARAAARVGDGLKLRHQFLELDLGILQIDLALDVDRNRQRLTRLIEVEAIVAGDESEGEVIAFGTALGVFSLVTLSKPEAKALFAPPLAPWSRRRETDPFAALKLIHRYRPEVCRPGRPALHLREGRRPPRSGKAPRRDARQN